MSPTAAITSALLCTLSSLGAEPLSTQRWEELGFGLSLHPPRDVRIIEHASDGALAKFIGRDYDISVFVQESKIRGTVEDIKTRSIQQLGFAYMSDLVVFKDEPARPLDRPGWKFYAGIIDEEGPNVVLGQVFMQIDPKNFAVIQFQCDEIAYEGVEPIFDAVLKSMQLLNHKQLLARNTEWINAGHSWRHGLTHHQIRSVLIPEQWFRVVRDEQDIGWMRIQQTETIKLELSGIYIEIWSHVRERGETIDADSDYFESFDRSTEVWSSRTTRRPTQPNALATPNQGSPTQSRVETGLRSGNILTVSVESAAGVKEHRWEVSDKGYQSQVELRLLPSLLPREQSGILGFYAYHPMSETLALRTDQITPLEAGAYLVQHRPSAHAGLRLSTYDAQGHLLRKQMSDGVILIRVSREQVRHLQDTP